MDFLNNKYAKLGVESAPGQEARQKNNDLPLRGEKLEGDLVDFSHGDVDAHMPIPGALEVFTEGFTQGGKQAYTEYRGSNNVRNDIAKKISRFMGIEIDGDRELIITPGTQGALFLAVGALVGRGDKVAIVEPDYFANRKLVEFFDGILVPITLDYEANNEKAGLDLTSLEKAFQDGVKVFLFSNPNNPTGVVYSEKEINAIAILAKKYNVALIVDELYSRQIFDNRPYTHLNALPIKPQDLVTIIGPSKTESLSGFRLGVALGTSWIIDRMEKLQAIVSLRAAGYSQAVMKLWFDEPDGFMEERIKIHQDIRDEVLAYLKSVKGVTVRPTEGGSYLFVKIPQLDISINDFVKCVRVLTGVTITPGTEFGPHFTRHFRINFSQDKLKTLDALKRVMAVMERYRK